MRCALSLANFNPICIEAYRDSEQLKGPEAIFFDGVDLAIFMLSITNKSNDLTIRYYVLMQSCDLLMQDAALMDIAG